VACFAALLLASSCQAAWGRQLSQAVSTASSVAGPGETVTSNSKAASEKGELTVSKVDAKGAGPGTTVNCEQEAKSGQIKSKECGGPAAVPEAGKVTFETAPACKKAPKEYKFVKDSADQKRGWGFEDGRSCALKDAAGKALPLP